MMRNSHFRWDSVIDNHFRLQGALSETSAPEIWSETIEVCITIDFAPWKEYLEENQKLNLSTADTLSRIWAGSLQYFGIKGN